MTILSILMPLFAIALLASLLEDKILFFEIKSKIFTPFFISLIFTLISGKSIPNPPFLNVSLAVCSALFAAIFP